MNSNQDTTSSVDELRVMLATAQDECKAARTTAAHYRLQCELLSLDSSEALKRKDVELDMARREVDVIQCSRMGLASAGCALSDRDMAFANMRSRSQLLELENQGLRNRLADAKRLVLELEASRSDEASTLRKRIRDNRQHLSQLRQSGSLFGEMLPTPTTTRTYAENHYTSMPKGHRDDKINDLLIADQYLSQEANSTPSTPIGSRQRGHRLAQSLTSLPSTPYRSAARLNGPYYLKPPMPSPSRLHSSPQTRAREDRDSTISASDGERKASDDDRVIDTEDEYGSEADDDNDNDVQASHASQEAASMLRKSASFRSPPSKAATAQMSAKQAQAKQSMMYGYQLKSGAGGESIKRRFYDDGQGGAESERPRKKGRGEVEAGGEGVGLGIGGWAK